MPKLKIGAPPFPNREEYPFTASVWYRGMPIDIENLDGSVREGTSPGGKKWRTKFVGAHYGELRGSLGTDGDPLDVYIKAEPDDGANKAYVIHQNHPRSHPTKGGEYDEDKVVLGVSSIEEAKDLYLRHYNRKDFLRSVTEIPIEKFKRMAFGENKGEKVAETTVERARQIAKDIGLNFEKEKFPAAQFAAGIDVEREHGSELGKEVDVGGDSDSVAARIAWAHLKELPDYYTRLHKMEQEGERALEKKSAKPATSFIRQKLREGGNTMRVDKIKEAASRCKTPGKKIRSKGKGRGLAYGEGEGPRGGMGTGPRDGSGRGPGRGLGRGPKDGGGKGTRREKTSAVHEAYREGALAALDNFLKEAEQKGFRTVLKKLPGAPVKKGAIPAPPTVPAVGKVAQDYGTNLARGSDYMAPLNSRNLQYSMPTQTVAGGQSGWDDVAQMSTPTAAPQQQSFGGWGAGAQTPQAMQQPATVAAANTTPPANQAG